MMTASAQRGRSSPGSSSPALPESLSVLVDRLRWDRRRHPYHGHREYSQAARAVAVVAEKTLTGGDGEDWRSLVPVLRKAVDRVTRALQYLDDSSGVIGQDLSDLMEMYARACCAASPPPSPLATWLVGLVWDGPGWPEVRLAEFAPALGPKGLSLVGDLVTERAGQRAAERAAGAAEDRWRDEWAAQHLREQLAQLTGDVDQYVGVLAEDLRHADRYRMIAAALQDAGRLGDAVEWARRGLADRRADPRGDRLQDLLVDLLVAVGDRNAAVEERRADFQRRPTAPAYQALQATTTQVGLDPGPVAEWALDVLRARVGEDPRITPHLVTVLLAEDRQDEAWSVAITHTRQLGEAQYVELLALRGATWPQDVVEPYRELVERHILDSRDKWRYERALKLLTPLRAAHLALGDTGWTRYLDQLRDRHRIRPTFLRKLDAWQTKTHAQPGPVAEQPETSR